MYGYGATSPPLTNNPFISEPSHPSQRFPDISTPPTQQPQYTQWPDGGMSSMGYAPQQQQVQQQQSMYQRYPQQANFGQQQMGYSLPQSASPTAGFQPTSSFGQQLAAHVSGNGYGYLQGGSAAQQTAYNPAQQQLQSNPNYIAALDPYSSLSQGWGDNPSRSLNAYGTAGGQSQMVPSFNTGSTTSGSYILSPSASASAGFSSTGESHPREFIRTHKAEIEAWSEYAWKQLLGTFDALKKDWEKRQTELKEKFNQVQVQAQQMQMQYGAYGGYAVTQYQQEAGRLQGLLKEADSNFDSVAASTFQMQEVFHGYRQSGDAASKRRVREATNAALQSLPNWPVPY